VYLRVEAAPQVVYRLEAVASVSVQTVSAAVVTFTPAQVVPVVAIVATAAAPAPTAIPSAAAATPRPSPIVTVVTVNGPAVPTAAAPACPGTAGPLGSDGLPRGLPRTIQFKGRTYAFLAVADPAAIGALTHVGCVGAFETTLSVTLDATKVIFLRLAASGQGGASTIFRFEVTATSTATLVIAGSAHTVTIGDHSFAETARWSRAVYSSVTVVLYVADPAVKTPDRVYARTVDTGQIAEYVLANADVTLTARAVQAAGAAGLNPDLTLASQRYVLVTVWKLVGATADGWVTLYAAPSEGTPKSLIGVDPRVSDLIIYLASGA